MPARAPWGMSTLTTATLRPAERQPELPREIGAQEVRQVGTVGREPEAVLAILPEPQVFVEEVPLPLARHLVERAPAGLHVERIVEELLDPRRVERLRGPAPLPREGPDPCADGSRRGPADCDLRTRRLGSLEAGAVRTGGPRRRLEIPPVGRSAAAFARRRQLPAVRGDEREGAVQRAVRHGHHAQRSAHDRRLGADENGTACGRLTSGRTAGDEQGEDEDGGTPWHGHDLLPIDCRGPATDAGRVAASRTRAGASSSGCCGPVLAAIVDRVLARATDGSSGISLRPWPHDALSTPFGIAIFSCEPCAPSSSGKARHR